MPATPDHDGVFAAWIRATPVDAPRAGEQIAEVFAHCHAEVAVEGLEDNVDGLATGWRVWLHVGARQVGNQEGPPNQAQELHDCCHHPSGCRQRDEA